MSPQAKVIECRVATLLLHLVIGGVINVAIAWWVAASAPPEGVAVIAVAAPDDEVDEDGPAAPPPRWADGRPAEAIALDPLEHRTGWPLASMACTFPNRHRITHEPFVVDGLALAPVRADGRIRPRALPLRPVWITFGVDTCFYAAVVGSLSLTVMLLRRPRGGAAVCPRCRQPGAGGERCPRCGWAFAIRPAPVTVRELTPGVPWYAPGHRRA